MEKAIQSRTLGAIAEAVGGELFGDRDFAIARPVPAGSADPEGIAFAESAKYLELIAKSGVGAVIVDRNTPDPEIPHIRVDVPRAAFLILLNLFRQPLRIEPGIHETARVSESSRIAETASIGPFCVIEEGAEVGDGAILRGLAFLGANSKVGARCVLHPHVTIYEESQIGDDTILHAGAVIGADGFGYAWNGIEQIKIPQVGRVMIGNKCEIGANTCIDRATCGDTVIAHGTKIDNLVQVGHNVQIGRDTVIASLVGLSGSCKVGDRVTIAGQVGFNDHVTIGDDVTLGGRTGVVDDLLEPGAYIGTPALPAREGLKQLALLRRLPELLERIKSLEAEISKLRAKE